ncbi:TetR/AcrR family transcriptional regulator [Streptomyces sp. LHD-70]|uniref:TetR/AcrR family transcriptional regulator n=1 Tax=Streptomyces sp. LHD-70 TaxID=3072140 RepID=UPI00280CBA4A|nr:TetR/AcrR family transcriptional regulator [Streptomyces sp. LHD-70]MDQ8706509.1 TetR/AcrR family transcriptional regulator [Streptomyces sp. LHD-70]
MTVKTRRQEYVEATRAALLDSAARLFTEKGFAHTSLDEVAASARVTKGALYHHFSSKQALFEHVLEGVNERIAETVMNAGGNADDPWERMTSGLNAFLDACLDDEYQRICLQQGPAVLGWERCREIEARMMGLLDSMLVELADSGARIAPSPLLTRVLFRMVSETALAIGEAEDKKAARAEAGELVTGLLASVLRGVSTAGGS